MGLRYEVLNNVTAVLIKVFLDIWVFLSLHLKALFVWTHLALKMRFIELF